MIKILITGGTLDKEYNPLSGELAYGKTHVEEMLKQANHKADVVLEEVMLLDSLDMTEPQRHKILQRCKVSKEDRIIITHGTDTMVESAKLLGENIKDKTIVFTGSMVPYRFKDSDALFNLGSAFVAVQTLKTGVFIVMQGKVFTWDNVKKDRNIGEFQDLKPLAEVLT